MKGDYNWDSYTVEPLNNGQSGAKRCPLFRGHLIHKVLWWDSNKCPLQRCPLFGGSTVIVRNTMQNVVDANTWMLFFLIRWPPQTHTLGIRHSCRNRWVQ